MCLLSYFSSKKNRYLLMLSASYQALFNNKSIFFSFGRCKINAFYLKSQKYYIKY